MPDIGVVLDDNYVESIEALPEKEIVYDKILLFLDAWDVQVYDTNLENVCGYFKKDVYVKDSCVNGNLEVYKSILIHETQHVIYDLSRGVSFFDPVKGRADNSLRFYYHKNSVLSLSLGDVGVVRVQLEYYKNFKDNYFGFGNDIDLAILNEVDLLVNEIQSVYVTAYYDGLVPYNILVEDFELALETRLDWVNKNE